MNPDSNPQDNWLDDILSFYKEYMLHTDDDAWMMANYQGISEDMMTKDTKQAIADHFAAKQSKAVQEFGERLIEHQVVGFLSGQKAVGHEFVSQKVVTVTIIQEAMEEEK